MENRNIQLTALDLLKAPAPQPAIRSHRHRRTRGANRSSAAALRLWANSVRRDQTLEISLLLLLWLCYLWGVGAAFGHLFL
jgi:hypothetical protein